MEKSFKSLEPLRPGDKVAILSPAGDAASYFPWVLDRGVEQLENKFSLSAVEYTTTRQRKPSPEDRARDVNEAFANPDIKAIFTAIGGQDQVRLLQHLDADIISANPKPYIGYSDNTNIIQYLWNLGIPAYYGGALMTQFAMQPTMFEMTTDSLRHALFDKGWHTLNPSSEFTDIELEWADKDNLYRQRTVEPNHNGWVWSGTKYAEGRLWGGCVEALIGYLVAGKQIPDFKRQREDIVLFLETAENLPDHWVIEMLIGDLAVRGVLDNVTGILVGRPKAWEFSKRLEPEDRKIYRAAQFAAVLRATRQFKQDIPVVQNLDFGHTDPQVIVPSGSMARIDTENKSIDFLY